MLKLLAIVASAILLVGLVGCAAPLGREVIHGTGPVVSRPFEVDAFTQLQVSSAFTVIFRQSDEVSVILAMQENLFDFHEATVRGGTLHLAATGSNRTITHDTMPRAYVYAPYLSAIDVIGTLHTEAWDTIRAPSFSITSNGALNMTIPLEVERLDLRLNGASALTLDGTASYAEITINGSADVFATNLQATNAIVTLNGTGTVEIAASDYLDATLEGVGHIRYLGNPAVTQYIGRTARGSISAISAN
ncbi:MAG: DUF2807 domain-containing protein [Oscillospiraceae bacterium]|nr:DUF2807 domain-containing protein [Oscillospiraceae bacterium]